MLKMLDDGSGKGSADLDPLHVPKGVVGHFDGLEQRNFDVEIYLPSAASMPPLSFEMEIDGT
jgi:hypothetical protein